MNQNTTHSDWRTVTNCLASQDYASIVKGLVCHFTAIKNEMYISIKLEHPSL